MGQQVQGSAEGGVSWTRKLFFLLGVVALGLGAAWGLGAFTAGKAPLAEILAAAGIPSQRRHVTLAFFVALALLVGVFLVPNRPGLRTTLLVVLGGVVVVAIGGGLLDRRYVWGWCLAVLPAALIVHHGLYLSLLKSRLIPERNALLREQEKLPGDMKVLVEESARYFDASHIALRYGIPAVLLLAVVSMLFTSLHPDSDWYVGTTLKQNGIVVISDATLLAVRLGALGAYVYVLLYLGRRSFRHDITSAAALWSSVTLVIGPFFACVAAHFMSGMTNGQASWAQEAIYFAAGFSPRQIAVLVDGLHRKMAADPASEVYAARTVPLLAIPGIDRKVEERLREEGVHGVAGLAGASPVRLQRNTSFDGDVILDWVDTAILMTAFPTRWKALEEKSLSRATDLCAVAASENRVKVLEALEPDAGTRAALECRVDALAKDPKVQRLVHLRELLGMQTGHQVPVPEVPLQRLAEALQRNAQPITELLKNAPIDPQKEVGGAPLAGWTDARLQLTLEKSAASIAKLLS